MHPTIHRRYATIAISCNWSRLMWGRRHWRWKSQPSRKSIAIWRSPQFHTHPNSCVGLRNLRGEVVTILDIHVILGIPANEQSSSTRNLIVNHDDELIGLRVDQVSDIMSIPSSALTAPPSNLQGVPRKLVSGVYQAEDRLILHIDLIELMNCCRISAQ